MAPRTVRLVEIAELGVTKQRTHQIAEALSASRTLPRL